MTFFSFVEQSVEMEGMHTKRKGDMTNGVFVVSSEGENEMASYSVAKKFCIRSNGVVC